MFTAVLFTIARTWKQLRCSLTGEWIQKMWYIYTMEYYSAIIVVRWMKLESITYSEVRKTNISQKEKIYKAYIWNLEKQY